MRKKKKPKIDKKELGKELTELWADNEEHMGEMAAYFVACEQLEIDPDDGWNLMADIEGES